MKSKWSHLKPKAIALRTQGQSLPYIHKQLGIPKSTLSNWLRDVTLTDTQKAKLHDNWQKALIKARKEAVKWHHLQKENRLAEAKRAALHTLEKIQPTDKATQELALAVLYLAEGSKKNVETALGSSDPVTLRFFINSIKTLFKHDLQTIRCELYLRHDQDPDELKRYWSNELSIPISQFTQVNRDKRTIGTATYPHYKGVCNVRCGNVAIRRRLVFLAEEYFAIISRPQ